MALPLQTAPRHDASPLGHWPQLKWWRLVAMAVLAIALLIASFMVGHASERDEASLTVQVSSADHEMEEGYFSLGGYCDRDGEARNRALSLPVPKTRARRPDNAVGPRPPGTLDHRTVSRGASAPRRHPVSTNFSSRWITSPTMLLGVEAPAVRPTMTGRRGQPVAGRDLEARRCRRRAHRPVLDLVADTMQSGSAM